LTSNEFYDTITLEYEPETGYVLLTDGKSRQVLYRICEQGIVAHWRKTGEAVVFSESEWTEPLKNLA